MADGLGGHAAGHGTTLTAMLLPGGRAALAHVGDSCTFRLRDGQLRQIAEHHSRHLAWDVGLFASVLARHLDGRLDRSADIGLRDLWIGGRYLLCSDGLSPVVDDRTHRNALTSCAASANVSASWPP